ncbi:hypothetical protein HanPI659440_Chr07g0274151 [Helianthus annuus]|nr:hypothetical protein HanPI659440_Chr07g0274151 [Helianthus annuus]
MEENVMFDLICWRKLNYSIGNFQTTRRGIIWEFLQVQVVFLKERSELSSKIAKHPYEGSIWGTHKWAVERGPIRKGVQTHMGLWYFIWNPRKCYVLILGAHFECPKNKGNHAHVY